MKKVLIFTLSFLLILTSTSFAKPSAVDETLDDLSMVDNNINMVLKDILNNSEIDREVINKQLRYNDSILSKNGSTISSLYEKNPNLELKRTYASLLYTISLYELSLSSLAVYLNDNKEAQYFFDSVAVLENASISLMKIKESNKIKN